MRFVFVAVAACSGPVPAMPWVSGFTPVTDETVIATYEDGVSVLDRDGHVIAKTQGFEVTGSADELIALAPGDVGIGQPVILVAMQQGGHRLSQIDLVLYDRKLETLFEGPIEEHEGELTTTGSLRFMPGALLYRAPNAERPILWTFDPTSRRYAPYSPQ
jgi:hypothetical protein